jgi:hypothetical protein
MSVGFIMLRHVNSTATNLYWQECYTCIRKFYPEAKIIILDDNSKYEYINTTIPLTNIEYIQSEFPGRGELLPYIYYLKYNWFDTAFILHDSIFIQSPFPTNIDGYMFVWTFNHKYDIPEQERAHISVLSNTKALLEFHQNTQTWNGCFGAMCAITYDILNRINESYTLSNLLATIKTRSDRSNFERILGCMLQSVYTPKTLTYLGDIHAHSKWGYTWSEYAYDKYLKRSFKHKGCIKVWTGR